MKLRWHLLGELVTDCPYPPMRTAAVGLVKEVIIDALDNGNIVSPGEEIS